MHAIEKKPNMKAPGASRIASLSSTMLLSILPLLLLVRCCDGGFIVQQNHQCQGDRAAAGSSNNIMICTPSTHSLSSSATSVMKTTSTTLLANEGHQEEGEVSLSLTNMLKQIHQEEFQNMGNEIEEEEQHQQQHRQQQQQQQQQQQRRKTKNESKKKKATKNPKINMHKKESMTKAEIKTLKFVMNQKVEELIEQNDPSAAQVAEDNIQQLQQLYEIDGNEDYKPGILSYNIMVRAYGKSPRDDASSLAEKALKRLIAMYENTGDEDIKPTVITYTEVIDAYARSKHRNAAEQAEEILLEMMEEAEYGSDVLPTSITCDVVIKAWAKRGTREGAIRAERILERMEYFRTMGNTEIQPSTYSFATVISAWAKSRTKTEGAERSQYILSRMIDFKQKLLSSEGNNDYANQITPDRVIYNTVIDAWARSGDARAGTEAEALLRTMEDQARNGINNITPDSITYNSIINCYANSRHISAAKSAEKILKKMELATAAAAEVSEDERKKVAPNTRTYNQVLKCYASSKLPGAPQQSEAILKHMLLSKNLEIHPDVISFCTCLDVWAKSKEKGKAEKSHELVRKLIELYQVTGNNKLKPSEMVYNTVLNCCAFSAFTEEQEKKKALIVAITLFNDMLKAKITQPDAVTYGTLIKCIANLVPKGDVRNKMASDVFTKCANEGLVNRLVFDEIRRAVPGKVLAKLLSEARAKRQNKPFKEWDLRDLPVKWRAKVVEKNPKKKTTKSKKSERTVETKEPAKPVPIRPIRRLRPEVTWQSGKDL